MSNSYLTFSGSWELIIYSMYSYLYVVIIFCLLSLRYLRLNHSTLMQIFYTLQDTLCILQFYIHKTLTYFSLNTFTRPQWSVNNVTRLFGPFKINNADQCLRVILELIHGSLLLSSWDGQHSGPTRSNDHDKLH